METLLDSPFLIILIFVILIIIGIPFIILILLLHKITQKFEIIEDELKRINRTNF